MDMVETPVLFITFCRPDYARQTWDGIKAAKPKKLYFYSNKGREEKDGEIERNNEIREYIKEIDWECELKTWFREECVDIYASLWGAIDWIFQNEPEAIILEEDCVPTLGFFDYAEKMLDRFRDEKRIWIISGDNILNYSPKNVDYILSRNFQIYGWASWKDRWNKIDWSIKDAEAFLESDALKCFYPIRKMRNDREWRIKISIPFLRKTKCWDGIFYLNMEMNDGLCIFPRCHLVSNIGVSGTHNKQKKELLINRASDYRLPYYEIKNEPLFFIINLTFDYNLYKVTWKRDGFFKNMQGHVRALYYRIKSFL